MRSANVVPRRHVYSASRTASLSRPVATGITFFVSAIAHELVMGCITRKFRGYGFVLMMMQMPFVMIQRMPGIRERQLLNNVMFWICMIMGLSLVSPSSRLHSTSACSLLRLINSCVRFMCSFDTFSNFKDTLWRRLRRKSGPMPFLEKSVQL